MSHVHVRCQSLIQVSSVSIRRCSTAWMTLQLKKLLWKQLSQSFRQWG